MIRQSESDLAAFTRAALRLLVRGTEAASPQEVADNPRAQSVRQPAAERVRDAA